MSAIAHRPSSARSWYSARVIPATTLVLAVVAFGVFAFASGTGRFEPGSSFGLWLGIAAAAALAVVMLYSVRRALVSVRALGRTRTYLRIHLWVGALFGLLFLLHTGFRVPSGLFTGLLWASSLWVLATGALGVLLQRWVPRLLRPTVSFEVHLRRVPELIVELRTRAEELVSEAGPRLRSYYEHEMAADFSGPRLVTVALFGGGGTLQSRSRSTQLLRRTLADEGTAALDELCDLHQTKREMDVHFTLQKLLRGWLYLHLPVAVVLLGLVVLHIFLTTYF